MLTRRVVIILIILISFNFSYSQSRDRNTSGEIISWTILQLIPSPVFYDDNNDVNSQMKFGLRWNIIPLNISFSANKYVSPVQFFRINPVRRVTGSVEVFLQPELITSNFEYSNLKRFGLSTGSRIMIPIFNKGEDISISLGGKYSFRKTKNDDTENCYGIETGIYFLGGILGFQFTKNFKSNSEYNFGVFIKYY